MFALIRHAGYHIGSGSLTPDGSGQAFLLADKVKAAGVWHEVRVSPTTRTQETGAILAKTLGAPMIQDERIGMDGDMRDLMPPTEPDGIVFVSHLPVLSKWLRAWSNEFGQDEPPLTEIASGYLIDPKTKTIKAI